MSGRESRAPSKFNDFIMNERDTNKTTPIEHLQCDGKTNNVTFNTSNTDVWVNVLNDFFKGKTTRISINGGCCLKVNYDKRDSVKINIYNSGKICVQGQKCVEFSKRFYDNILAKVNAVIDQSASPCTNSNVISEINNDNSNDSDENTNLKQLARDIKTPAKGDTSPKSPSVTSTTKTKIPIPRKELKTVQSQPTENINDIVSTLQSHMQDLEKKISDAVVKVCCQQSELISQKLSKMEDVLKEHKSDKLGDKLDQVLNRLSTIEKENALLKKEIQNMKHTSELQIQCQKSEYENKILKIENDFKCEVKKSTNLEHDNKILREKLSKQQTELDSANTSKNTLTNRVSQLEEERISLKIHAGAVEDKRPMSTVVRNTPKRPATDIKTTKKQGSGKPRVILIGTSNTEKIDPKRLSSYFTTEKHIAYTLSETRKCIEKIDNAPQAIILHSLTNDLKNAAAEQCVDSVVSIVENIKKKFRQLRPLYRF